MVNLFDGKLAAVAHERVEVARTIPERTNDQKLAHVPLDTARAILTQEVKGFSNVWFYKDFEGLVYWAVVRFDTGAKKKFQQFTFTDTGLVSGAPPSDERLPYNYDLLIGGSGPVVLCEGEKAADAATKYIDIDWTPSTWAGGSGSVAQTNFEIFIDRPVFIWPDNDKPGFEAAEKLKAIIDALKKKHKVTDTCYIIDIQKDKLPDKWDLADASPDGYSPRTVINFAYQEYKRACSLVGKESKFNPAGERKVMVPRRVKDIADFWSRIQPVGKDEDGKYLITNIFGDIVRFSGTEILRKEILYRLHADPEGGQIDGYWQSAAMALGCIDEDGGPDLELLCRHLMHKCDESGVVTEDRVAGRGVHMDKNDSVVVHLGDKIIVNGVTMLPSEYSSGKKIYTRKIPFDGIDCDWESIKPIDMNAIERYITFLDTVLWTDVKYKYLVIGWIGASMLAGGLKFRPHIWITGSKGSGKTWLVEDFFKPVLGFMWHKPQGGSTEAGIRNSIGSDSLAVVFDEAEKSEDQWGESKRAAILDYIRNSSSDTSGRIYKGFTSYSVRSCFCMSSVDVGLKRDADKSRFDVIYLDSVEYLSPAARKKLDERRAVAKREFVSFCTMYNDFGLRFFKRLVDNIRDVRKTVDVFGAALMSEGAESRRGDQLGTLLGCYWMITHNEVPTLEQALNFIITHGFLKRDQIVNDGGRDDDKMLAHMLAARVKVDDREGKVKELLVSEAMDIVRKNGTHDFSFSDCLTALERFGIVHNSKAVMADLLKKENSDVFIGQKTGWLLNRGSSSELSAHMQRTTYGSSWVNIMLTNPSCYQYGADGKRRVRFAGGPQSSCLFINDDIFSSK